MSIAKQGDRVRVHYTGRLDDGTVFDSSEGGEPLAFTLGEHSLIPGFEEAVVGMETGESRSMRIPSDEAYGPRHDHLMVEVDEASFPPDITPEVGQMLQVRGANEEPIPVTIANVEDGKVTLDANHPLAGHDLTFEIELVEIEEAGDSEESEAE